MCALPKLHHAANARPCTICGTLMHSRCKNRLFCRQHCKSISRWRKQGLSTKPATDATLMCGEYIRALREQRDSLARFLHAAGVAVDPEDLMELVVH